MQLVVIQRFAELDVVCKNLSEGALQKQGSAALCSYKPCVVGSDAPQSSG